MDDRVYWVWLQHGLGAGSPKLRKILERYVSPSQFYAAGSDVWERTGFLNPREVQALQKFSLEEALGQIEFHKAKGVDVLTPEMEDYPEKLRQIYDLPAVLYVWGKLPPLDTMLSIGVVGTRKATPEGMESAHSLSKTLARQGVAIISGGAIGIDNNAHRGALAAEGVTVCVLGCGIGYSYLKGTHRMQRDITCRGAVISEYPIGAQPLAQHFPQRNRIISGLSDGILVIQAGRKSGSLITAQIAQEQDRDIFVVPGSVHDASFEGGNDLIQSGAKLTISADDILEEYAARYPAIGAHLARKSHRSILEKWKISPPKKQQAPKPAAIVEEKEEKPPAAAETKEERFAKLRAAVEQAQETGVWTLPLEELPSEREVLQEAPRPMPPPKEKRSAPAPISAEAEKPYVIVRQYLPQAPLQAPPIPVEKKPQPIVLEKKPEPPQDTAPAALPDWLSEAAGCVYRALTAQPQHITELVLQTKLTDAEILAAVTELELEERIQVLSGNRYQLPS